jgi:negative regulator of flagellin synthesis FlgM
MSEINATRSNFFPNSTSARSRKANALRAKALKRNNIDRSQDIKTRTSSDAKVSINDAIKDFSRIKRAVDAAPPIDNSDKIAALKAKIQAGTYNVDYDKLADKMLKTEF